MNKGQRHYYNKRNDYLDLLGGKCTICGSIERLRFVRKDPEVTPKIMTGSLTHSSKKILSRLHEHYLLCAPCHIAKLKANPPKQRPSPRVRKGHGSTSMYRGDKKMNRPGCRCDICKAAQKKRRRLRYEWTGH